MLTSQCLGTRHSSCPSYPDLDGCSCHCHTFARMPPVQFDYTVSVTVDKVREEPQDSYYDQTPTIQTDPEVFFTEEEYQDYIRYLQDEEYASGYYQSMYLDEPFAVDPIEEDVRIAGPQELDEARRLREDAEKRQQKVAKAIEVIQASKPRQKTLDELFGVG